jgi:hypothetical protein
VSFRAASAVSTRHLWRGYCDADLCILGIMGIEMGSECVE